MGLYEAIQPHFRPSNPGALTQPKMRAFYLTYRIVPPSVGQIDELQHLGVLSQIPWSHNVILMEKLDNIDERIWYANKTMEYGWSRDTLATWKRSSKTA